MIDIPVDPWPPDWDVTAVTPPCDTPVTVPNATDLDASGCFCNCASVGPAAPAAVAGADAVGCADEVGVLVVVVDGSDAAMAPKVRCLSAVPFTLPLILPTASTLVHEGRLSPSMGYDIRCICIGCNVTACIPPPGVI